VKTPGSVLWLLYRDEASARNVEAEAARHNVTNRIVWARRANYSTHLGRQRLADIFLDPLLFNSHTVASDALALGRPVVTSPGVPFASRVCSDVVLSAHLPELVAVDTDALVEIASRLGTSPALLARLHRRTAAVAQQAFDSSRFTRGLERALMLLADAAFAADVGRYHIATSNAPTC